MRKYVELDDFLGLCQRNGHDVKIFQAGQYEAKLRGSSLRKQNRDKVARMLHRTPSSLHSWFFAKQSVPLWAYELLAYKWNDHKGLEYARKLSGGVE